MGGPNPGAGDRTESTTDGTERGARSAERCDIEPAGPVSTATDGSGAVLGPEAAKRIAHTHPIVVVLGDSVLDVWRRGRGDRLSREASVPVVEVEHTETAPGGAAHTATYLAALGARVRLIGLVGDDAPAAILRAELERAGVDASRLHTCPDRATTTRSRIVAGDRILLRYDEGAPTPVGTAETDTLLDLLDDAMAGADALVVGDRDGAFAESVRARLAADREWLPLLIVDTYHPALRQGERSEPVTTNAGEVTEARGISSADDPAMSADIGEAPKRAEFLDRHGDHLSEGGGSRVLRVTPDRAGTRPTPHTWTQPVPDGRAAGAGDTFIAALTLALVDGMPPASAVELARAVACRPGGAAGGSARLRGQRDHSGGAVLDPPRLHAAVRRHRAGGARIVFTNGCFDVLHAGHIAYLNEAKRLGDVLIVAVNSDAGVRRLKGPDRPVNPERDRCAVLAALSCVDHVTIFDADTPVGLLRDIQPDLYVKGGDYRPDMLPETSVVHGYGGEVRILGYLDDHSTSATIERIRSRVAAGA